MKLSDLISREELNLRLKRGKAFSEIKGLLTPDDIQDWFHRIVSGEGTWILFVAKTSIFKKLTSEVDGFDELWLNGRITLFVPPSVLNFVEGYLQKKSLPDSDSCPYVLMPDFDRTLAALLRIFSPPEHASLSAKKFLTFEEALKRGWIQILGDPSSVEADGAFFAPWVVLEEGVKIGSGSIVYSFTFVGRNSHLGQEVVIYPHVYIGYDVQIGSRVILRSGVKVFPKSILKDGVEVHEGTIVGSHALAYYPDEEGRRCKIPQIGYVEIGENVEILANSVIERGGITRTVIGDGTKVGNLVIIGHNSRVGRDCVLVGGTMMAGSTKIGDRVITGGQVGIADHTEIASDVLIGAKSAVAGSIRKPGVYMFVVPVMKADKARRTVASINRLYEKMKEYDSVIAQLKKKGLID